MNRIVLLVSVGMVMGAASAAAHSVSYTQRTTAGGEIIDSYVVVHDDQMRVETTVKGQSTVVIKNSQGTFSYMPAQHMAMKIPDRSSTQQPVEHPDNYLEALARYQAHRVGAETIDGHPCDVYEWTTPEGTSRVWIWTEQKLPIRVEVKDPQGRMVISIISDVQLEVPAPASLFELPPGVSVMDTDSLMQNVQGLMQQDEKR